MPQLAASDTSDGSSSEDAHTAGSEIEQMLITDDWTMKEYILGKRYFEVILMGHLLKSATCDESLPEFDSRFSRATREYPYGSALRSVHNHKSRDMLRDATDDHEELMTTIGAIFRTDSRSAREQLVTLIEEQCTLRDEYDTTSKIATKMGQFDEILGPAASGEDIQVLKEHGDEKGVKVEYIDTKIQVQPPRFEATVLFNKYEAKADGRSKKEARQKAAQKACIHLGVHRR
ncbi:hypothetical protein LTS16_019264 [Friedmanniomyces endolithicus]|nr:hypothetical protein LTS16_019264 [Friedmanniomyces endolithicus]